MSNFEKRHGPDCLNLVVSQIWISELVQELVTIEYRPRYAFDIRVRRGLVTIQPTVGLSRTKNAIPPSIRPGSFSIHFEW
jgi:hypothetical protein